MIGKFLLALVCGVFTLHAYANEQDHNFWFPNESLSYKTVDESVANQQTANDSMVNDSVNDDSVGAVNADHEFINATKLRFTSRRAALNPAVKNQDNYLASDEWIGATYVDEQALETGKRLKRQFRGKRPQINYQFD